MPNDKDNANAVAIDAEDVAAVPEFSAVPDGVDPADHWKAEAEKYQGMANRRGTKLSKLKDAPKPKADEAPPAQDPNKGEFDYGQKAFLISNGIKDPSDMAYVKKTMADTGKTLDEVIATPFIQAELKRFGEERTTQAAIPPSDGRNNPPARNSVDYWLNKGHELPPNTEDNQQLRRDIVKARRSKESKGAQFTKEPVASNVEVR